MVCTQKRYTRLLTYLSPLNPTSTSPSPNPSTPVSGRRMTAAPGSRIFFVTAVKVPGMFDPNNSTKQLIHWRCGGSYEKDKKERSTLFDTGKLEITNPEIIVELISKDYTVSLAASSHWESKMVKQYTTTDIYNLLVTKKFNHYSYSGNGSGCLTWTTALVELLEDEGVLPEGSMTNFLRTVQAVRADPKCWVPDEPGAMFYE